VVGHIVLFVEEARHRHLVGRVVVLAQVLLQLEHRPTRDALDLFIATSSTKHFGKSLVALLLLLQHLLNNLLLLDQEGTHNPLAHTGCTAGTAIGTSNCLLVLCQTLVHHWPHVRDPLQHVAAVATLDAGGVLADVVEGEHTTRRLNLANLVGLGRVRMTTAVCEALDHADCKEPHDYKANITKRRRSCITVVLKSPKDIAVSSLLSR